MTIISSMGQGAMLAVTIGFSLMIANGVWGMIAPSGRTLEQYTASMLGGKTAGVA